MCAVPYRPAEVCRKGTGVQQSGALACRSAVFASPLILNRENYYTGKHLSKASTLENLISVVILGKFLKLFLYFIIFFC